MCKAAVDESKVSLSRNQVRGQTVGRPGFDKPQNMRRRDYRRTKKSRRNK